MVAQQLILVDDLDGTIHVVDPTQESDPYHFVLLGRIEYGQRGIARIVCSPAEDNIVAIGTLDNGISLFDDFLKVTRWSLKTEADIMQFRFSGDGAKLAVVSVQGVAVICVVKGVSMARIALDLRIYACALSNDGSLLALGGEDGAIALCDVCYSEGRMNIRQLLLGHSLVVFCLAFSPDDKMLASGSGDSRVIIWDTAPRGDPSHETDPLQRSDYVQEFSNNAVVTEVHFCNDGRQVIYSIYSTGPGVVRIATLGGEASTVAVCSAAFAIGQDGAMLVLLRNNSLAQSGAYHFIHVRQQNPVDGTYARTRRVLQVLPFSCSVAMSCSGETLYSVRNNSHAQIFGLLPGREKGSFSISTVDRHETDKTSSTCNLHTSALSLNHQIIITADNGGDVVGFYPGLM